MPAKRDFDPSIAYNRPREFVPVKAFFPNTNEEKELHVSTQLIDDYFKKWKSRYFELKGRNVTSILFNPETIFAKVRDYENGGICYCGYPEFRYTGRDDRIVANPSLLFTVYVSPQDSVYLWNWELRDDKDPRFPTNYTKRYGEIIWPR